MLKIIAFIALVLFAGFIGGHIETGNQWADIILSMINGLLLGYGVGNIVFQSKDRYY